jgi:polyisoprenoid-binding protein YceI
MLSIRTSLALFALTTTGLAFGQTRDFKIGDAGTMKVAQTFSFSSDADFENFTGQTHSVSGLLRFDPAKKTGSGKLRVALKSIDTGIALRNEHLNGEMWFNTAKFPTAEFETTSVKYRKGDEYDVVGKLSLHGVTRTVTVKAIVKHLKESDATRKAGFRGDVCHLKTSFQLKLADYGVMIPGPAKGKVAESITANISVFGYSG